MGIATPLFLAEGTKFFWLYCHLLAGMGLRGRFPFGALLGMVTKLQTVLTLILTFVPARARSRVAVRAMARPTTRLLPA